MRWGGIVLGSEKVYEEKEASHNYSIFFGTYASLTDRPGNAVVGGGGRRILLLSIVVCRHGLMNPGDESPTAAPEILRASSTE